MKEKYCNGNICYPDLGCDGDGFHFTELNVPIECTYESLGITDCAEEED